jgi:beta-N-acetylhexosaminidase
MKALQKIALLLYLGIFLVNLALPVNTVSAGINQQTSNTEQKAQELLNQMTPEERIGQLFLVSFQGNEIKSGSSVYDLITNHHIGGVILNSRNNNFIDQNILNQIYNLTGSLQQFEWDDAQNENSEFRAQGIGQDNYVPLFIAVSQEGDSYPYNQILSGVTQLPNQMAIGATFDTQYAEEVGKVLGSELHNLGFNMLIGPSLDVLDLPYVEGGDDLGTRTFGGDPYWVGELGKAYIRGVHSGSENGMAVIAKHFPGRGSSDRLPDEEVATVRKSLEQLKQIELAPFFAVTGNAVDTSTMTDGLLVSHIRYQGFQGNIRATTRPVSFDQAAQEQLMNLPELASWRAKGGVVVSDNLGSYAVRKFFDPTGDAFDVRQIARNAFLSGNDLLILDLFVDPSNFDPYSATLRILESFAQKYREDTAFATRVNSSVLRLLKLKYQLYPEFDLNLVIPEEDLLLNIGSNQQINSDISSHSAVLMSPDMQELSVIMPSPPQINERVVFITETVSASQCADCPSIPILSADAIAKAVLRLYGPGSGEQVLGDRMSYFSFTDLSRYLADPGSFATLDSELRNANWIVFSFIKPNQEMSESLALKKFLSNRIDLQTNKKIVAFGLNAPYYLDATDISKLTAYYVMFGKTSTFVETIARILFQEVTTEGSLPVNVPGIAYDLINAMSPDPLQIIPVFVELPQLSQTSEPVATPPPNEIQNLGLGETITLRSGVIYDHNQNQVPDGTVVRFLVSYEKDLSNVQQIETTTFQGVARVAYRVQNTGLLRIKASSDPALNSRVLEFNIPSPEGAEATIVVLNTPEATPTLTPTQTITSTPPIPTEVIVPESVGTKPDFVDWLAMSVIVFASSAGVFFFSRSRFSLRWAIRWTLLAVMGGIILYLITTVQIGMNADWTKDLRTFDIMGISFSGVIAGWLIGWFWYYERKLNI